MAEVRGKEGVIYETS